MKILLIMNPGISVPPKLYGGIERMVYLLAEEYHKLGHEVILLAGPGSYCSGSVVTFGVDKITSSKLTIYKEIFFVWKFLFKHKSKFDLIHNFGRLYFTPFLFSRVQKIMSYQRKVSALGIATVSFFKARNLMFTGCSDYCVSTGSVAGKWTTVYNGLDFSKFEVNERVDLNAPLMFLGRLDRIKGVHTAIKVAKITSQKLLIGGNIPDTADNYAYFKKVIEPQFDNKQIIYLGELDDESKIKFLRQSKALLFPIEWDEPFGIVMIEAMACGTPVIAYNRGAVPEVVDNGITGFKVDSIEQLTNSTLILDGFDRINCKNVAESKFNIAKIAKDYLNIK
jgi:glycosyltransferase involved in cell wall biosynthesis